MIIRLVIIAVGRGISICVVIIATAAVVCGPNGIQTEDIRSIPRKRCDRRFLRE